MSKAELMFRELGYTEIVRGGKEYIEFGNKNGHCINVWLHELTYDCDESEISIELHLAIHELMKELCWINLII